jgi:hypothetical protein
MQRGLRQSICLTLAAILAGAPGCVSNDIEKADQRTGTHHFVQGSKGRGGSDGIQDGIQDDIDDLDEDGNPSALVAAAIAVGVVIAYPFVQLGDAISRSNGNTPLKSARAMDNPDFPDARIQGINDLVTRYTFARRPPYTIRYAELAEHDPDYLVRATAIRALNISRDNSATPIFIAGLDDEHEPVRLEACKALNNVPDERAIPGLLRRLEGHRDAIIDGRPQEIDEDADVRIAAAQALRRYPKLEVATALVGYLNERDFAVAWQSHRSLEQMTRSDWQYDEAAWLRYLSSPKKPLAS